jgi:hypothetical protein
LDTIFLLGLLGFITWFWFDTLRCRELTKAVCREVCRQLQLQLLDDTIALQRMRLKRDHSGKLSIQRLYHFEFYDGSNGRHQGTVLMQGGKLELIELPGYLNRIISPV